MACSGGLAQAVHDQRLDLRLELASTGFSGDQLVPRREVQLALGRAGRARIQRDDPARGAAREEEREADRDLELRPQVVVEREDRRGRWSACRSGRRPGSSRAHRAARLADAEDAAVDEVQQVAVVVGQRRPQRSQRSTSAAAAAATARALAIRRSRAMVSALAVPVGAGRAIEASATSTRSLVAAQQRHRLERHRRRPRPARRAAGRTRGRTRAQVSTSPCQRRVAPATRQAAGARSR